MVNLLKAGQPQWRPPGRQSGLINIGYGMGDNPDDPYGLTVAQDGRMQPQGLPPAPNTADYGGGLMRGGGTVNPVAPLNPTPVAPTPVNPDYVDWSKRWWDNPANAGKSVVTMPDGTVYNMNTYENSQNNLANLDTHGNYVNPTTGLHQWAAPQQQRPRFGRTERRAPGAMHSIGYGNQNNPWRGR